MPSKTGPAILVAALLAVLLLRPWAPGSVPDGDALAAHAGAEAGKSGQAYGLPAPQGAKVVGLTVTGSEAPPSPGAQPRIQRSGRRWGLPYRYLQNVTWSQTCEPPAVRRSSGVGPGTLTTDVSQPVKAKWNAPPGTRPQMVSAGVGFDVTRMYPVAGSHRLTIPAEKLREVAAYPLYDVATFEVWYKPWFGAPYPIGNGRAARPAGICFVVYEY